MRASLRAGARHDEIAFLERLAAVLRQRGAARVVVGDGVVTFRGTDHGWSNPLAGVSTAHVQVEGVARGLDDYRAGHVHYRVTWQAAGDAWRLGFALFVAGMIAFNTGSPLVPWTTRLVIWLVLGAVFLGGERLSTRLAFRRYLRDVLDDTTAAAPAAHESR